MRRNRSPLRDHSREHCRSKTVMRSAAARAYARQLTFQRIRMFESTSRARNTDAETPLCAPSTILPTPEDRPFHPLERVSTHRRNAIAHASLMKGLAPLNVYVPSEVQRSYLVARLRCGEGRRRQRREKIRRRATLHHCAEEDVVALDAGLKPR